MQLVKCDVNLTRSLYVERKQLLENYVLAKKSLSLLMEGNQARAYLETKIEFAQLNEVLRPYYLHNRKHGESLYERIVRKTIACTY